MTGYFFYNLKILGDVLVVVIKEDSYTKVESYKDLEFFYNEDELVQIHYNNISSICKIVAEGRIVIPPKSLVDFINQSIKKYKKGRIDYVKSSGFIVGNVISQDEESTLVDLKEEIVEIPTFHKVEINSLVVYARPGARLIDNSTLIDSKFLGHESLGQICTYKDLGLNNDDKVVLLDKKDAKVGEDFFLS